MDLPEATEADAVEAVTGWARSGLMALTGPADGPPVAVANPVVPTMRAIGDEVDRLVAGLGGDAVRLDPVTTAIERAAFQDLHRGGSQSPGGGAEMHATADGWLALNHSRADDAALFPAWLAMTTPVLDDVDGIRARPTTALVSAGAELGLAVAGVGERPAHPAVEIAVVGAATAARRPLSAIRVLDLSAMWAGPLAGEILARAGAAVTKVEALGRPDRLAVGSPELFGRLNGQKARIDVDLSTREGLGALRRLVAGADLVIDASRPRAMSALGIDVDAVVDAGTTWLRLTGHGWHTNRVAFGDDAAVAGGAVIDEPGHPPWFLGDALADPLTGWAAAFAALTALTGPRFLRVEVNMAGVVWHVLGGRPARRPVAPVHRRRAAWQIETPNGPVVVAEPGCAADRVPRVV